MVKIFSKITLDLQISLVTIYSEFNSDLKVLTRLRISQTVFKFGQLVKISRDLGHLAKLDFTSIEVSLVVYSRSELEIMT